MYDYVLFSHQGFRFWSVFATLFICFTGSILPESLEEKLCDEIVLSSLNSLVNHIILGDKIIKYIFLCPRKEKGVIYEYI